MEYEIHLRQTDTKKIYVDPSGREGIYLYPTEIRKLSLSDGDVVSEEELEEMRLAYALPRAKKRAIALLAKNDRTEAELCEKLHKSLTDSLSLAQTVEEMKRLGYVDDLQYARDYIYFKKNRKSFRLLQLELRRKGICEEILAKAFEEEGAQKAETLLPQMRKYAGKFSEWDPKTRQKIYAHFARKGYEGALIREAMEAVLEEE